MMDHGEGVSCASRQSCLRGLSCPVPHAVTVCIVKWCSSSPVFITACWDGWRDWWGVEEGRLVWKLHQGWANAKCVSCLFGGWDMTSLAVRDSVRHFKFNGMFVSVTAGE